MFLKTLIISLIIVPKVKEIPINPKLSWDCSFTIIAPVSQSNKTNVSMNSAKYFLYLFDKKEEDN